MPSRDGAEHEEHEQGARDPETRDHHAELRKRSHAEAADRECHGAERANRRHPHDDANHAEQHLRELVDEIENGGARGAEGVQRKAKEDGEAQDLEDVGSRKRVDGARGNDGQQEVADALCPPGRDVLSDGATVERRGIDVHPASRLHDVHDHEAYDEREGGDDFEVNERQHAGPAHRPHVAHPGDARHHRAEDDGANDHAHELDEPVAERPHRRARIWKKVADQHADGGGDEDLSVESCEQRADAHRRIATGTNLVRQPTSWGARLSCSGSRHTASGRRA